MTAGNFVPLVEQLLQIEGGVSDRPERDDPGKLTNKGVTQAVYDQWRSLRGLPSKSVREITRNEAVAIAKANYWAPIRGDQLPSGVDFAVFDFSFNSGPAQAVRDLQRVLGVAADGIVGLATLEALAVADDAAVITDLCDRRLAFMKKLKNWRANRNGWTSRVAHVRAQSLALASGEGASAPDIELTSAPLAKAPPTAAKKSRTFWATVTAVVGGWLATAGNFISGIPDLAEQALGALGPFAEKSEYAQWLLTAIGGLGAAATVFVLWQVRNKEGEAK
ncbi:MAG TPA: glycosyl hydrolase 108 family protein [Sphingomicrobium sp.]|nr:glycosyl hydrolase 108 family protein [Sphingomicrobium sp.]